MSCKLVKLSMFLFFFFFSFFFLYIWSGVHPVIAKHQRKLMTLYTVKKKRKIYGRITGNQLPVHVPVPLFLREPEKLFHVAFRSHVHISIDVLRAAVKVTVNALAAGCQLFYRKLIGFFYNLYIYHQNFLK